MVDFINRLGYEVELDAPMKEYQEQKAAEVAMRMALGMLSEDDVKEALSEECRPAGDCNYMKSRIRVREGKSPVGQVTTLIHESTHAIGLGGISEYCWPGESYYELAAESVTQFVTKAIGIDRTKKTSRRIMQYGFGDYLDSPLTQTLTRIILDELGVA